MGHCIKCRHDFEGDGFVCPRCKYYLDLESSVIDDFADRHPALPDGAHEDAVELRSIQRLVAFDMLNASMEMYQPLYQDKMARYKLLAQNKSIPKADRVLMCRYVSTYMHICKQIYYTCGHGFGGLQNV